MARSANQKRKLLILEQMLSRQSDEEHPISTADMLEELERWGITAERKSLYDDMEHLREMGLDVQNQKGRGGGWFLGAREFELAELKLLVDAVQSSRFLTGARATPSSKSWRGSPRSTRPGSCSGRCTWTGGSRP